MQPTVVYWGDIGMMENEIETTIVIQGCSARLSSAKVPTKKARTTGKQGTFAVGKRPWP